MGYFFYMRGCPRMGRGYRVVLGGGVVGVQWAGGGGSVGGWWCKSSRTRLDSWLPCSDVREKGRDESFSLCFFSDNLWDH